MKGFIRKSAAGLALTLGLGALNGCVHYRNLVDPCYPERYNYVARDSVQHTFNQQAANGHVLDQTVWNYHFQVDAKTGAPTDKLSPAGEEHLKYLIRRRPSPDAKVYLQTAQDIPALAALPPDKATTARADLDNRRVQAVQMYLGMQMAGRSQMVNFEVAIHDPASVGMPNLPITGNRPIQIQGAVPRLYQNFQGVMPIQYSIGGGGASGGSSGGNSGGSSGGN